MSFLIPVRDDADRLRRCLASIEASRRGTPVEVIVADNGSTDSSAGVAHACGATVLDCAGLRVAAVRNAAADHARAELLAFVDADHELDPGWTTAALEALADPTVSAAGAQYHAPADGTWVQRMYDGLRSRPSGTRPTDWLPSGNLVVRRADFQKLGGFDVSLETCEDVDFCQRLRASGGRLLSVDGMRSVHLGDPATLMALFLSELWRGRDNLRVTLRVPLTWRTLPSILIPVATLSALGLAFVGLLPPVPGGRSLVLVGTGLLLALTSVRAGLLVSRLPAAHRHPLQLARAVLVAFTYNLGRALALTVRSGHRVRRRG